MKISDRILQLEQQIADMERQIDAAVKEIKAKDESLEDLVKANSDFDNLLLSAEIGALYIDGEFRIRKMTPIMGRYTNLCLEDTGRLITEISLMDEYKDFLEDVKNCMQSGNNIEREIQKEGNSLLVRLCPYYVGEATDGILVTLFDITKRLDAVKFELQVLINNIPGAVTKMCYDGGLIIEYANDTMYSLMKLSRSDFLERYDNHYERMIHESDWIKLQKKIEEGIRNKESVWAEFRVYTGQNTWEWRTIQASILEERGSTPILQCIISDITEEKLIRLELEKERKKLGAVVRMSGDMIFEYDIAEDHMTYTSPGEGLLFSEQITENYINYLSKIIKEEDRDARQALIDALQGKKANFNIELRRKGADGEYHWVLVSGQTIYDKENCPEKVLGKIQNIDEQKKKEDELRDKSQKDSLTGLFNHMTAKQIVAKKVANLKEGQMAYLIISDIDNFKSINDINGHMFGDAVICSFADQITQLFPDAVKGRIGGDEFMTYVEDMDREALENQLSLLNSALSDRYDDTTGMHISCSIGVVSINGSVRTFETLFQWADYALYRVKSDGKGSYLLIDVKSDMAAPQVSYLASEKNKDVYVRNEALIRNEEDLKLFCLELLENVPNLSSALKMICERTCSFFGLDDMVCVEHEDNQNKILYQWNRKEKKEYTKRMHNAGVYEWRLLSPKTDEKGVILYREEDKKTIEKDEAKSAMIVLSKEIKGYQGSVIFTDRQKDRDWERERDTLQHIANHIFTHLRTRKKEAKKQCEINRKLNYDALTGLPVYNRFVQLAEEYIEEHSGEQLFCVYSDFSNFQYLNEVYGYEEGDKVLRDYARSLEEEYQEGVLFCRVTSDHFLGIINADNQEQAVRSYTTFCERFCIKTNAKYGLCNLVMATGVYEMKSGEKNVASMMDKANEARKKCKSQKVYSSILVYSDEIRAQVEGTKSIVANMVSAYKNKEFIAYLQPKVSLKTGKIVGAEALVRWIRPDGTQLMPNQFIDIFEQNGFVTKVDFAIFESVLEYLRDAIAIGEEVVPISVNFSRRHNEFDAFVPSVFKYIDRHGVPYELLEVELTESVFLADLSRLSTNLKRLRDRGIEVSVDDFGSGYSSLNLLSRVAVDTVKLDKQFLDTTMNAVQEETALTIIKYLIKLLKRLGFKVLAEGVETKEQINMLKKADCDFVQGYYYAKPMPIPEFREFLKDFNGKVKAK
ncbi:MAG: EAL domain-containing protein [Lachnospiraceae bacterium]|nr:EAL domain-containing protein [Lachnospiraceae bacterium]